MAHEAIDRLRALKQWFDETTAAAEQLLPALLDLQGPALGEELERHPELRAATFQLLLRVVDGAVERFPLRAYELTSVLVELPDADGSLLPAGLPLSPGLMPRLLKGRAFTAHAKALRNLGRLGEARDAVEAALAWLSEDPVNAWHLALASVVQAQILYDLGEGAEALRRIRPAADTILQFGNRELYVQTRMTEAWMHWDGGDPAAATEVWRSAAAEASRRRDAVLLAELDRRIGIFLLHHGDPEVAARHFTAARQAFDQAGLTREAVRAHWNLAEAAAARGRYHEAVSEYHQVQALLLAAGDVVDAATASAEILDLLLIAGRDAEVLPFAERLVPTLADAGLQLHSMRAWTWARSRARAAALTREDLATVRRYFETLPLQPNAPFPLTD